jgi:hypothetical protein
MTSSGSSKKNKIVLSDYDYKSDIENRILMSGLSVFDVLVLEEILNSSLTIPLSKLCEDLDVKAMDLIPVVDKLGATGLLQRHHDKIIVDKEMRKYFESQLPKFEEDFEYGMEFLQSLLRKVPIHVLPIWYSIPRTATNIFEALVEKYLQTPRLFQRYQLELNFEDPVLNEIMKDVFSAPDFLVSSSTLREKHHLSRSAFEEYLLHLEFNFICCVSYRKVDGFWEEVVTPFHEWHQYLSFRREKVPSPIPSDHDVSIKRATENAFASDLQVILQRLLKQPLALDGDHLSVDEIIASAKQFKAMPAITAQNVAEWRDYFHWLIMKLQQLELAEVKTEKKNSSLVPGPDAKRWATMKEDEIGLEIYRHPETPFCFADVDPSLLNEKNFRELEKALEQCPENSWVYLDDLIKGVIATIGQSSEVSLQKKGRRWEYALPSYSSEELVFIKAAVMERFFEAGFISIGTCKGQPCLKSLLRNRTTYTS